MFLTATAYYPSLFHVARADQVTFLAEYAGRDSSLKTVIDSLFYNRTRLFSPGDVVLFRPLLFLMLSLQRLLFGYGFFWWQLIALSAHLFTITALWRLLRRWSTEDTPAVIAVWILTLSFAFLFSNLEAVIWHGITPYVFFAGFILTALERLDVVVISGGRTRAALTQTTLCLLAAILTYEAGVWYVPCFFVYALVMLRGTKRAHRALILLLPLVIYAGWSAGHFLYSGTHLEKESTAIAQTFVTWKTFTNLGLVIKWFITGAFFLQPHDLNPLYRLMVGPAALSTPWPFNDWITARWIGVPAVILILAAAGTSASTRLTTKRPERMALLGAMLLGYVLLIVAGRANIREDGTGLHCSLYYFYNFWTLFTALLFLLLLPVFQKKPVFATAGRWPSSRSTTARTSCACSSRARSSRCSTRWARLSSSATGRTGTAWR